MWVFLNDAALSIVAHRERPDCLLVHGRVAGDIEAVFPKAVVTSTPDADNRYRASIRRHEVAQAISARLESVSYDNFKDSCRSARHRAYMGVLAEWMDAGEDIDKRIANADGQTRAETS